MLVFRSLAIGLLGACFLLLVTRPSGRVERQYVQVAQPAPPSATIIDVAHGVTGADIVRLLHLDKGEHVIAVDDRAIANDLDAGSVIASTDVVGDRHDDLSAAFPGSRNRYLDLTV